MYRSIVIGYDGTEHARDAATLALALAGFTGARVTFVNAFYDIPSALPADPLRDDLRERAAREVAEMARGVPRDIAVAREVVTGRSPARSLYEFAERHGADLIVLGSSGAAAEGQVLAGRVASQVVDSAPCAVAIAPAGLCRRGDLTLREIAVGFDGRPESEGAMATAAALAKAGGARLHVTAVVEPLEVALGGRITTDAQEAIHESLKTEARNALDRAGTLIPEGVEVNRSLLQGHVGEALAAQAAGGDIDLLVVGSRGFGPIRRVLLGSVSATLMRSAPCPLIVVPRGAPHSDPPPTGPAEAADPAHAGNGRSR